MEGSVLFLIIVLFSFFVFAIPKQLKYYCTLVILIGGIVLTSYWSIAAFSSGASASEINLLLPFTPPLVIDTVSAFFIIVINLTVLVGFLYAKGYLKPYYDTKNSLRFSIHYFSYLWLWLSMILVVMIRDGVAFLIAWELMALSSFLLVIFEAEDRTIMKTGISYLVQMHVGMFLLLISFLIVERETGQMSFDALRTYFANHSNILLFLLFFIGFGVKAGLIPFHTWLPQAHPAAPSHVSGVMSGVMIKMGIYGIIRVLMSIQYDLKTIGLIILIVSLFSGLYGIMMAIVQKDLKRMLAYSSMENIGIIGIGIGIGIIGVASGNNTLSLLGLGGGMLHVLNHSLFKSLLFFNAGSVYQAAHTRNTEQLGGLMKKMPYTAGLFLIGSLAISGLPPFNGFISEYLIYIGIFKGLSVADLNQSVMLLVTISGLVLIGGLAIFCFTKAFGIVFLGEPRSERTSEAIEVSRSMIVPQLITASLILLTGVASLLFVKPVFSIVTDAFNIPGSGIIASPSIISLSQISILSGIFVVLSAVILFYRHIHLKGRPVSAGPTWGCGYTAGNHRQQYTSASYAYNFNHLAKPLLQTRKIMEDISEDEIFPAKRTFEQHSDDSFKKILVDKPVDLFSALLKKIAVMQTGEIRHYILYAFIFMLLVFLLTMFKII
ncbi:MAG: proton-conducting transporter membrane subunit [Bacteroidota bacterium]